MTVGPLFAAPADDAGPPVTTPRIPAREAAERELSRGEYHRDDPGLLNRILDWLWDHISSLLNSAAQASPGGWLGLTVIALLVVLLAVAVRLRLGALRPGPVSDGGTLFDKGPRSAAEHRTAAEAHASAERWSQALQERMRAVVRSLEERALLDHRPGRTADEAAVEAGRALPGHADELRSAARAFDEVTYANRDVDASAYEAVRELDSALQRAEPLLRGAGHEQAATGTLVAQGARSGEPNASEGGGS
ncbi:DUF4129 domain-containing protein [Streptomyces sp. WMMB 322]|uniref:DUF4129 domain-containing protein n=1 Tax=Streptomyces sp. WMMB 322 TaxID=1286821 RepID=UPI000944F70D|nr:DUF4129 domain-containing protein [Streptomyces sp. WMMB 322]